MGEGGRKPLEDDEEEENPAFWILEALTRSPFFLLSPLPPLLLPSLLPLLLPLLPLVFPFIFFDI